MPKESDLTRIATATGVLLLRCVNDADGNPVTANITPDDLASIIALAIDEGAVVSVNGATGAVVLDAGDIAFTPEGTIAATTVQAAIVEASTEGGSGDGIPYPETAGTDGQVLAITDTDPSLVVGWVDASASVDAAISDHNAEFVAHGRDLSNVLDTDDIGVNVQVYHSGAVNRFHYDAGTGWPARNGWPTGMAEWINGVDATAPPEATAGDTISLTGA